MLSQRFTVLCCLFKAPRNQRIFKYRGLKILPTPSLCPLTGLTTPVLIGEGRGQQGGQSMRGHCSSRGQVEKVRGERPQTLLTLLPSVVSPPPGAPLRRSGPLLSEFHTLLAHPPLVWGGTSHRSRLPCQPLNSSHCLPRCSGVRKPLRVSPAPRKWISDSRT